MLPQIDAPTPAVSPCSAVLASTMAGAVALMRRALDQLEGEERAVTTDGGDAAVARPRWATCARETRLGGEWGAMPAGSPARARHGQERVRPTVAERDPTIGDLSRLAVARRAGTAARRRRSYAVALECAIAGGL